MKDQFLTSDYHRIEEGFFYPFSNNGDGRKRCYDDARRRSSCVVALVQRVFSFSPSLLSIYFSCPFLLITHTQLDPLYLLLLSLVHY